MSPRGRLARHHAKRPCPICGGHPGLPRGRGIRCAGFTLERVAYCTREEFAGPLALDFSTEPPAYKHRLTGPCDCGVEHGGAVAPYSDRLPARAPALAPELAQEPSVDPETKDAIYRRLLSLLELRPEALGDLTGRGLSAVQAQAAGYRSFPRRGREHRALLATLVDAFGESALRACPGLTDKNGRLGFWTASPGRDGYVVPYCAADGRITGLQAKLLGGRYLTARGTRVEEVYHVVSAGQGGDLYLTEGATKANVAAALGGVAAFAVPGQALRGPHISAIAALKPARVIVALDQEDNPHTAHARERWLRQLAESGLPPYVAVWEGADLGGPKGVDDLFQAGGRPRTREVPVVPAGFGERRRPFATAEPGPVEGGGTLGEARAQTAAAVDAFVRGARRNAGKALLVASAPGVGKSTALARAVAAHRTPARILVGTKQLAAELASQHGYALVEGRHGENCERPEVVRALGAAGHNVERLACGTLQEPRCPVRATCGYWAQFRVPGARVAAAEQLFNPHFLAGGTVVVLDDADLLRSAVDRHRISAAELARSVEPLRRRRRRPLAELLQLVQHAVVDAPDRPLVGAAVWDHLARTAARYGVELGELVRALPGKPSVPEPEAGADGQVTLEGIAAAPPATLLELARALRDELVGFESCEDFNSRLRLSRQGMEVWALRAPAPGPHGLPLLPTMALLVLDATPVEALVAHVARQHERLPDVRARVRLPENVRVVQYAGATNGHTVLADEGRLQAVLAEVAAERLAHPVAGPAAEGAVVFRRHSQALLRAGFAESQVLTFGAARGTNALVSAERLHIVGRPMPPSDDVSFLAQVIHHPEPTVSRQMALVPRAYGSQRVAVEVVDFVDGRAAALLRALRDDELTQVVQRARLFTLEPQLALDGDDDRRHVRLLLHTSHPVPGLRVDELHTPGAAPDVNGLRRDEAERRIWRAVKELIERGEALTDAAVARAAGASRGTVAKARARGFGPPQRRCDPSGGDGDGLGMPAQTARGDFNKGVGTYSR